MNFTQLALVFLGGGIGASMRWLLSASAVRFLGTAFPAGTFAVNLIGCFLMGLWSSIGAADWEYRQTCGSFSLQDCSAASRRFRLLPLEAVLLGECGAWRFPCFMRWAPWSWGLAPFVAALH